MRATMAVLLFALGVFAPVPAAAQDAVLRVEGQVRRPLALDRAALAERAAVEFRVAVRNGDSVPARGVPLWDLLAEAEIQRDPARKASDLGMVVLAIGADGYRIAFSVGELDPGLGGAGVMVAFEREGQPLATGRGPFELIVPRDGRKPRQVHQLVRLEVRDP